MNFACKQTRMAIFEAESPTLNFSLLTQNRISGVLNMLKLNYPFGIYQFFASFLQTKRKCSKRNDFLESGFLSRVEGSRPDVKRDFHMVTLGHGLRPLQQFCCLCWLFFRVKIKALESLFPTTTASIAELSSFFSITSRTIHSYASVNCSSAHPPGHLWGIFPHCPSRGPGISLPRGI